MKRNLSQLLQTPPNGGHSKEAFDLHNTEYFHSKGGQLNVVGCREVFPDTDFELSVDAVTRTLLCNTANFADIKEDYYFVFVPYYLVCSNAYQMLVQRRQDYSALSMEIQQFPVFDLAPVVKKCIYWAVYADMLDHPEMFDIHGFNIGAGALRLLDNLGYGSFIDLYEWIMAGDASGSSITKDARYDIVQDYIDDKLSGKYPSVARIGAYQCIWYNFFRNPIYDTEVDASIYNFDDVVLAAVGVDPNYEVTDVRGVDNFIRTCLKLHYVGNRKDMFMGSMPGTQFGACASVPLMHDISFILSGFTGDDKNRWSPFGADSGGTQTFATPAVPSPSWNPTHKNFMAPVGTEGAPTDLKHNHALNGSFNVQGGTSLFDVLTLVQSQAMQKWRQKSMLAGNKTVDQFRAHHGTVPRHLIDHLPDFIGSVDNIIHVSEITSTANTLDASAGSNNLGEIRGRGYGVSDRRTFHFHSDDYGMIFLLQSITTENVYPSFGLDYGNRLIYYSDFFQQEFQNIGLEAVPKFLLDTLSTDAFGPITDPHADASQYQFLDDNMSSVIGMYAKYYGYKEYYDKCHGLFNPTRISELIQGERVDMFGYADMQSFIVPRADMHGFLTLNGDHNAFEGSAINFNLSKLYQNPRLFDSIFGINADDHFDTDEFFHKVLFICNALLPSTKLGLPDF